MKKRSRSLTLLKFILGATWWGGLAVSALLLVLIAAALFNPDEGLSIDIIGYASDVDGSALSVVTRDGVPGEVEFENNVRLKITLPDEHWESRVGLIVLAGIGLFLVMGLFLYLVRQLRAILWSVDAGDPFIAENAVRLRVVGILILLGGFVGSLSEFAMSGYADVVLRPEGFNLNGHLHFNMSALISGLCIIVLSEVFRHGTKMREEQELTV